MQEPWGQYLHPLPHHIPHTHTHTEVLSVWTEPLLRDLGRRERERKREREIHKLEKNLAEIQRERDREGGERCRDRENGGRERQGEVERERVGRETLILEVNLVESKGKKNRREIERKRAPSQPSPHFQMKILFL